MDSLFIFAYFVPFCLPELNLSCQDLTGVAISIFDFLKIQLLSFGLSSALLAAIDQETESGSVQATSPIFQDNRSGNICFQGQYRPFWPQNSCETALFSYKKADIRPN